MINQFSIFIRGLQFYSQFLNRAVFPRINEICAVIDRVQKANTLTHCAQNIENPAGHITQQPQQGRQKPTKESGNEEHLSQPLVMYRVHQLSSFSNVLNVSSSRMS